MSEIIQLRTTASQDRLSQVNKKIVRQGTVLEKGVVLTMPYLESIEEKLEKALEIWSSYPDIFLEMILPADSNFSFFPYQRIWLRAFMRYTTIFITAVRAAAKTFLSILAKYVQCMFVPNHVGTIIAPGKAQGVAIATQKIKEIWTIWPLLKNEVEKSNMAKDYIELTFKNGSRLFVGAALDSGRGLRTHAALLDEARDLDGDMVQEVILPQLWGHVLSNLT